MRIIFICVLTKNILLRKICIKTILLLQHRMSGIIKVPISIGELCDKYTILQIKREKICDEIKLSKIECEINYLQPMIDDIDISLNIINDLKEVNTTLWGIEDNIRVKESRKQYDEEFVELARSVYFTNDIRFDIKNKINSLYNSVIFEVKSYEKY